MVSQPSDFFTSLLGPAAETNQIFITLIVAMILAALLGEVLRRAGRWLRRSLRSPVSSNEWDSMSGLEFEEFLAELFRRKGFTVEKTPVSGDYGVDLILTNPANGERIAVQAKRYAQPVGIAAVQEVFFGAAYYQCQRALVVTNADYTPNARNGAARVRVWLIDGAELKAEVARLAAQPAAQTA